MGRYGSLNTTGCANKNNQLEKKFIISVTVIDFFTKFTAFRDEDSGHIHGKFRCNICYSLKTRGSAMTEGLRDALVSRNSATTKHPI